MKYKINYGKEKVIIEMTTRTGTWKYENISEKYTNNKA